MRSILFITGNENKWSELEKYCSSIGAVVTKDECLVYDDVKLILKKERVKQKQHKNPEMVIRDKVKEAFKKYRVPVIVDHSGIKFESWDSLPGPFTQCMYEFTNGKLMDLFVNGRNEAKAKVYTYMAYTDGKEVIVKESNIDGVVMKRSSSKTHVGPFFWDNYFIPRNNTLNYKEYKEENIRSIPRIQALKDVVKSIKKTSMFTKINKEDYNYEKLVLSIKNSNAYLFVGSGVSRNLGLHTITDVVQKMAEDLEFEPEIFNTYGDFMLLAEYYEQEKGLNKLKDFLQKHSKVDYEVIEQSKIYNILPCINFPVIYTTNYDDFIERSFDVYNRNGNDKKTYQVIRGMKDNSIKDTSSTQIIKLHGDFTNSNDIVLTETSFVDRITSPNQLDDILKADIMRKTFLFIGYSMNDINLRILVNKISNSRKDMCADSPKIYIFDAVPNKLREVVYSKRGIVTINSNSLDVKEGLVSFLKYLHSNTI